MADVFNSKHTSAEIEDILDSAGLVSTAEDETYSVKIVDSAGTLLLGIKLTGELDVPIGITDDNYTLLKSICEKLSKMDNYVADYTSRIFDTIANRKSLIDKSSDSNYTMKLVDAEGNLLLGFKLNGEIDAPIGITDGAYEVCLSIYGKLKAISSYMEELENRISKLENNN